MGLYGSGLTHESTARAMMIHMYATSTRLTSRASARRRLLRRNMESSPPELPRAEGGARRGGGEGAVGRPPPPGGGADPRDRGAARRADHVLEGARVQAGLEQE